jgi:hypothetical protein
MQHIYYQGHTHTYNCNTDLLLLLTRDTQRYNYHTDLLLLITRDIHRYNCHTDLLLLITRDIHIDITVTQTYCSLLPGTYT